MNNSNRINLADPVIRRALHETGKWSRIIAIISGVILALFALGIGVAALFAGDQMSEVFLENPMLPASPIHLIVLYALTVVLGIYVSIKLFQFGKLLKGRGPMQPLSTVDINSAFQHMLNILKYYAVFSVISLLVNVLGLLL